MEEEKKVKGFTFYRSFHEVIKYLSPKEKLLMYEAINNYIFEDVTPELDGLLNGIWSNFSKVLDKSKKKSNAGQTEIKTKSKQNQNEIKIKSNENQNEIKRETNNILTFNFNLLTFIKEIIDYLNIKTNSNYKYNTKSTERIIKARINEGYVLEDFKKVIDKKYDEWNGTDFEKFLRPETLFGNKFESYLNQKETQEQIRKRKLDEWVIEGDEENDKTGN